MFYKIVLLIIVIVAIITFICIICKNKFDFAIIKIDEAESNIDIYLDKKLDLLKRACTIVKKELKIKTFLSSLEEVDGLNHFEFNDLLDDNYNELLIKIDENDKLSKSKKLKEILDDLEDNEEDRIGTIKFYNDAVVIFNSLVKAFPSNIYGFFRGYKKKEFYNDEKKEIYEILNKEEEKE